MGFCKTLPHRLFHTYKNSNNLFRNPTICRTGFPPQPNMTSTSLDPGDHGVFRRFLHRRAAFGPPTASPGVLPFPVGLEHVMEQLVSVGVSRDRITLDGLTPPGTTRSSGLSVEDTRKLVRLAEVVRLKTKLKKIPRSCITYQEFVRICGEDCVDGDQDHGLELAKMLDRTGAVIVLGNVVFLDPEQIAKAIAGLIPTAANSNEDPRSKELEEMEKQKGEIDAKATLLVRREQWWGLGFLVAQTAAFMRLTFWELSWDVMEPVCYFVTSSYFMAGYSFFLTTSKEPSFEGLYHSRFLAKQRRLMKLHNFDVDRYNRLRKTSDQKTPFSSSNHHYNTN